MLGYVGTSTKLVALTPTLNTVTTSVEKSPLLNQSVQSKVENVNSMKQDEINMKLYPIPATDQISIDFHSNGQTDIVIIINDMTGRMLKKVITKTHEGLNKIDLSLNEFISGEYMIQLRDKNKVIQTGKFVKL